MLPSSSSCLTTCCQHPLPGRQRSSAELWKAAPPGNLRSTWLQLFPPGESASLGQSLPAGFQGF